MDNNTTDLGVTEIEYLEQGDIRFFGFVVGLLVFTFGTVGNGLTVWAYARNKNLQTSFNVLIANLCLIDLLFTVIVIPFLLPGYIVGHELYSNGFCSLIGYMYYVSLATSLYNLVVIAINRYVGIVKAKRYQKLFSGQRLAFCISSIWSVPALLYLPVVIDGAFEWNNTVMRCAISESLKPAIRWYNLALNIIFQAIPLIILIIAYTAIFREVKRVKSKVSSHRKTRKSFKSTSSASSVLKHKSGNTSDDTGDELQPSSLIEGIGFKPIKTAIGSNVPSVSHDTTPAASETENGTLGEKKETQTKENETFLKKTSAKKRNSILTLLLHNNRNNIKTETTKNGNKPMSPTLEEDVSNDESTMPSIKEQSDTFPEMIPLKNIHRKRSISTPNLQVLDIENISSFNLIKNESKTSSPAHFQRYLEDAKESSDKFQRTMSLKTTRRIRARTQSDTAQSITSRHSLRIKRSRKEKPSTSTLPQTHDDNHQETDLQQNTLNSKYNKSKRRSRTQRKKRDRERQLAYTSFMICIAFAICILPTSMLYLIRILGNVKVDPAAILIISSLAWFHSVVNPWIYGYLNPQYKKEYKRIFNYVKTGIHKKEHSSSNAA